MGQKCPVPGQGVLLPLPPERAAAAPGSEEVGDELKSAYWMQWEGEAARTSVAGSGPAAGDQPQSVPLAYAMSTWSIVVRANREDPGQRHLRAPVRSRV